MGFDADKIKIIAVDVDGTLTDGRYTVNEKGLISKAFHTRDFYALNRMIQLGYEIVIMTSAEDEVIQQKCEPFNFSVFTGVENKVEEMSIILKSMDKRWENVCYIGDAENDLECMQYAGFTACPLDAIEEVVDCSNYQFANNGGYGAVYDILRKFCSYVAIDW